MPIYLGGGGSSAEEAYVWRHAFRGISKFLYWPFALPHPQALKAEQWLRSSVDMVGIAAEMETWFSLDGKTVADMVPFDLLFIGGGSTSALAHHIYSHNFHRGIHDFVGSNCSYYGGSAGAILATDTLGIAALTDNDYEAESMEGLGLIHQLAVLPHANAFSNTVRQSIARTLQQRVLILSDNSGAVFDGETLFAIGPGAVEIMEPTGEHLELDIFRA